MGEVSHSIARREGVRRAHGDNVSGPSADVALEKRRGALQQKPAAKCRKGSITRFCHIFRVSGCPPIASRIATAKIFRIGRNPQRCRLCVQLRTIRIVREATLGAITDMRRLHRQWHSRLRLSAFSSALEAGHWSRLFGQSARLSVLLRIWGSVSSLEQPAGHAHGPRLTCQITSAAQHLKMLQRFAPWCAPRTPSGCRLLAANPSQ